MKINGKKIEMVLARNCKNLSSLRGDGLSSNTLTRVMNGKDVKPITVGKIAKKLGVDPVEIIEMED